MKIVIGIIIAVISIGALIAIFILNKKDELITTSTQTSKVTSVNEQSNNNDEPEQLFVLTTTEVAKHNSSSDCWAIIDGEVFDLTSFIDGHPGGSEISRACGNDATTLFKNRETTDGQEVGSGTPHSSSAQSILSDLKIGQLKD